jgi:AcrR family transcriptional regulator
VSGTTEQRFTRLAPDERRAEVLEAAQRVLVRDGFAAASAAAVAREAGVTRSLVHHYFGSTRELFLAVLGELAERMPAAIRTDLAGEPIERVVEINSKALLDAVERDREVWARLIGDAGTDPDVEAVLDRARDEAVRKMLVNQSVAVPDSEELRLVLRVYLGAAEAAIAEWTRHGRATRRQTEIVMQETLLSMLRDVLPRLSR